MSRTLFGYPRGIAVLFGTEMWERMSYYGMRALLVGYLVKYLFLPSHVEHVAFYPQVKALFETIAGAQSPQSLASLIYGSYVGFIYLTPLLGGWLADTVLGQRKTALIGMALMAFGHFAMAVESMLFPALLLLIFGGGLFKSNTTAQVGLLYKPGDPARDAGYAVFYIGINLGGFLAPLVCGTLGEDVGWHYGFAAAGVGILLGMAVYLMGWRDLPPEPVRAKTEKAPRQPLTAAEWKSIAALLLLVIPLSLYWACNEQWGNTIVLWSIDDTDRAIHLFGWRGEIPWTWFQAINPFVIFAGTPLVLALWRRQGARQPSATMKMVWGCHLMTAANLLMAFTAWQGGKSSWLWLTAYFVILTVGEIYLYPVSLSLFSRVAPRRMASLMAGVVFLPNFLGGGFLEGWLGTLWDKMDKAVFFMMIAAISTVAALIIWAFDRPLRPFLKETIQ
jgi:proton-dependent oligopeptide transporter, POT family